MQTDKIAPILLKYDMVSVKRSRRLHTSSPPPCVVVSTRAVHPSDVVRSDCSLDVDVKQETCHTQQSTPVCLGLRVTTVSRYWTLGGANAQWFAIVPLIEFRSVRSSLS